MSNDNNMVNVVYYDDVNKIIMASKLSETSLCELGFTGESKYPPIIMKIQNNVESSERCKTIKSMFIDIYNILFGDKYITEDADFEAWSLAVSSKVFGV